MRFSLLFTMLLLTAAVAATAQALPPGNLIINGDFQKLDAQGWATGWPRNGDMKIARDGEQAWLVVSSGGCSQTVKLDPAWSRLKVTCRMKTTDVVVGKDSWMTGRLPMEFRDAQDKHLDPWPNVFAAIGTTPWTNYEREYRIPDGATKLTIGPANLGASGTAEFDDIVLTVTKLRSQAMDDAPLPAGAMHVWDMATAARQKSATRETICLNDLWRFLPLNAEAGPSVPGDKQGWCWFKVPGIWPNTGTDGPQSIWLSDWAEDKIDLNKFDQAWYKRELTIPADWTGKRLWLDLTMLQTQGRVYVDGKPAGELWFPGGRLDLTSALTPGKHELAILVTARPTESESHSFTAPDRVTATKATVSLKGLTGDVFLEAEPQGARVGDVHVVTSVSDKKLTLDVGLGELGAGQYRLTGAIFDGDKTAKTLQSQPFTASDLKDGRFSFSAEWANPRLWDTDTPQNVYHAVVKLEAADGKVLDEALPELFGFREFRISGRDFLLNGKPIHLRALLVQNLNQPADVANLAASKQTCQRLKEYGFNFFITGNYNFQPGTVGYMNGLLQAGDETGLLQSFSLPHMSDFRIDPAKPETQAAYRALTEYLIRHVQNHPSVIMYAMNHNATGYYGDQNPLKIDGKYAPETAGNASEWSSRNRQIAPITAAIARSIDPTRPIYHHESGNLGDLHTVNIYLNWAPAQERSDWLEHWATEGVKPVFFVEWGLPHISSWSSFRGPAFIWRNPAFQSVWDSEFAADYVGQEAYRMTPTKVKSLALEEELWTKGEPFYWSNLNRYLGQQEENYLQIQSLMASDNWRSHRTWGLSAGLPWDQEGLWRRDPQAVPEATVIVPDNLANLQQPGIVPDRLLAKSSFLTTTAPQAYRPSSLGRTFLRWNMPLCAYVGGGPQRFTEKGHNFAAGETVRKQLVVLNDTRREAKCDWSWKLDNAKAVTGSLTVAPGSKAFVPVAVKLTPGIASGEHTLAATFRFADGTVQADALKLNVLAPAAKPAGLKIALFDPPGLTAKTLDRLGVKYVKIAADAKLAGYDLLVIGRQALTPDGPSPDLSAVSQGLRVLVFEQTYDTLTRRLGFRANVHGMRQAYLRASAHPALSGLGAVNLRDWRGAATLVEPYLETASPEQSDPKWDWMGFINTRVWRCGNSGDVASVLIEKPSRGGFLPLVDCGFDLQYSPLMEYADGKGRMIFCQMDVTGRSETDPAADKLCLNLLGYLQKAPAERYRPVAYAGDERGAALLRDLRVPFVPATTASAGQLLVLGPKAPAIAGLDAALQQGARVLCLGLDNADLQRVLPGVATVQEAATTPSLVEKFDRPELAGISNSDLHWHTLLTLPALTETGPDRNQALAVVERGPGRVVLCQAAPWMFDYQAKPYVRTTYRRNVFLVTRLLANLGAQSQAPVLAQASQPAALYDWPLPAAWKGQVDRTNNGEQEGRQTPAFDDSAWQPIRVGEPFDPQIGQGNYVGQFWYRLHFRVPTGLAAADVRLWLGPVDDESRVWLNGKFLGEVTKKTNPDDYYKLPREYALTGDMLYRDRENVLVVWCNNTFQTGGIMAQPRLIAKAPWLNTYYLQAPQAGDDPYRYYRW